MNVLFLTLLDFDSIRQRNIYTDLLREFSEQGHRLYVISPVERKQGKPTRLIRDGDTTILKLRIGNTQKTNLLEKGISTLLIEPTFIRGIRKYFSDVRFDLVIYSTPPITFCRAIEYVKKRDGAATYLLLKDIFPQNAVDMGMLRTSGLRGLIYGFFRRKEKRLYSISDRIGCMSPANVRYILEHNPQIDPAIVEECPNSVIVEDKSTNKAERQRIREKYGIPLHKKVFLYGGNLGRPQGIPFLTECLKSQKDNPDAFFLVVGDGTEYGALERFVTGCGQDNIKLMRRLPKEDYDTMVGACDVGMIFLDHRFTIPNFPSRLLSYMQSKLPVLACTDPNTDIGQVICGGGFGWWCESSDVGGFCTCVQQAMTADAAAMGEKAFAYLQEHYSSRRGYEIIMGSCNNIEG